MKYPVELPPREFASLIEDLLTAIVGLARYKLAIKKTNGNAHPAVLHASSQIARMERAIQALRAAQFVAEHPAPPQQARRENLARNVGDELSIVYGRPRNPPVPRKKLT